MSDVAIKVENLSKLYRIGAQQRHDTLRDTIADFRTKMTGALHRRNLQSSIFNLQSQDFWALKDVSFEVKRGEVVGIIGRNGAGKSTLLKILSRITEPTEGRAEIHGRVGSLLEVGTGFHPELTGRENIFLNGAILGMHRHEIAAKFDEIVAFSEIEKFLDTPVKRYSSGMYVRLAFAVAAHLEPEILLVDEVLAVGDYAFQRRCLSKMGDVAREGRTVLFVSHNMSAIANLTRTALVCDAGQIAFSGDTSTAVSNYLGRSRDSILNVFRPEASSSNEYLKARITDCQLTAAMPQTGKPLGLSITIEQPAGAQTIACDLSVSFLTMEGTRLFQLFSAHMGHIFSIGPGTTQVTTSIETLPLVAGNYKVNLWLGTGTTPIHWLEDCMTLRVEEGTIEGTKHVEPRGYPVVVYSSWSVGHEQANE